MIPKHDLVERHNFQMNFSSEKKKSKSLKKYVSKHLDDGDDDTSFSFRYKFLSFTVLWILKHDWCDYFLEFLRFLSWPCTWFSFVIFCGNRMCFFFLFLRYNLRLLMFVLLNFFLYPNYFVYLLWQILRDSLNFLL